MRAILLIAGNFAREQRWPAFFLLLWVVGWSIFGLLAEPRTAPEDVLMIFKQLAAYSAAFAVFFGSSAIHGDQRSRRILAVLSKAVSRTQYLAGLLTGMAAVLGLFCLCFGFTATWMLGNYGVSLAEIWAGMLALFTACLLTSALTLMFSTFLPPLFAAIASGVLAGLPAVKGGAFGLLPVYELLRPLLEADFNTSWHVRGGVIVLGWVEVGALLLLASAVFARRDLAVARE